MSEFKWGTVTAVSPFRVQLDGDTSALGFVPDSLVTAQSLVIADRVRVELAGTRVIVHGRNGGDGALFTGLDSRVGDVEVAVTALETRPQGVIPSSVVVGSGSASVAADGTVTFTGASSVSLNGVFDGLGADRYRILFDFTTSGAGLLNVRLRSVGTDAATAYDSLRLLSSGGIVTSAQTLNVVNWIGSGAVGIAGAQHVGEMNIVRPALAVGTVAAIEDAITPNPMTSAAALYLGKPLLHRTANSYDGTTFFVSTGTITGTMKVVKIA